MPALVASSSRAFASQSFDVLGYANEKFIQANPSGTFHIR
jgi:hypothetical protein